VNVLLIAAAEAQQRGLTAAAPVIAADFASAQKVGASQHSLAGRLCAIPPDYLQRFELPQISSGRFDPQGVMVSEAMATAQHLQVGDQLQLTFTGVPAPASLPITGIVNMDHADALFATTTEAENTLVADVVFVDQSWFQQQLQAPLVAYATAPNTQVLLVAAIYSLAR
jgi:ABC-type lipoprotein release transport system permease subunit